jgi:hypothetical protein
LESSIGTGILEVSGVPQNHLYSRHLYSNIKEALEAELSQVPVKEQNLMPWSWAAWLCPNNPVCGGLTDQCQSGACRGGPGLPKFYILIAKIQMWFFWDRFLLYSPDWPPTQQVSVSLVLELQKCSTMPRLLYICIKISKSENFPSPSTITLPILAPILAHLEYLVRK